MKKSVALIACASSFSAVMMMTSPASAKPADIDYGINHSQQFGYYGWAVFYSGTGHIRATLGCDSGSEHYTIYGPWKAKNGFSETAWCASASTSYYQTKNS